MKPLIHFILLSVIGLSSVNASENYNVEKDIVFKQLDDKTIKLDLYTPKIKQQGDRPLLVWVHGGAWKRGSKDAIPTKNPLLLNSVLREGYTLAMVNYRLSGEASFPAPVEDINDAINYLHQHAKQYQISADNIVIMGRSAGGHLANLIGASNTVSHIGFYKKPEYKVSAVVSFFGPTDILALGNKGKRPTTAGSSVSRFLGTIPSQAPELAKQASPTYYISEKSPAFMMLHGDLDRRVPLDQSVKMKALLDKYGVDNKLLIEKGVGHSAPIFDTNKYVPDVVSFIKAQLPIRK
ncbi:alpha/beta hydrolase fold domain-containing protein [Psychromonas sp. KJ10-10]|uniref:alpha/beta hydrolase fold domain-containing protein n=1 Tax=Psychromonas sp. KJ10-10 TaxID=3391823 RepID=UPI0039B499F7